MLGAPGVHEQLILQELPLFALLDLEEPEVLQVFVLLPVREVGGAGVKQCAPPVEQLQMSQEDVGPGAVRELNVPFSLDVLAPPGHRNDDGVEEPRHQLVGDAPGVGRVEASLQRGAVLVKNARSEQRATRSVPAHSVVGAAMKTAGVWWGQL